MEEATVVEQSKVDELQEQILNLQKQIAELNQSNTNTLNMLRFVLGVAHHAMPENKQIKAMIDNLFRVE